jgi:hypothetical protein
VTQSPHNAKPADAKVARLVVIDADRGTKTYLGNVFYGEWPRRSPRRPSIATLLKRAEKTGKSVTSITMPDGTTINFGESNPNDANNPWLAEIEKATKQ